MAETVVGLSQLERRLAAISGTQMTTQIAKELGLHTVREAKLLVHRKTGNLGRSIHVESATPQGVRVVASAHYSQYVELGTNGPYEITPKAKKALRFAASAAGRRLSGAPRAGAAVVFAKHVTHPGNKPYPFLLPGAKKAVAASGLKDVIITRWNSAA